MNLHAVVTDDTIDAADIRVALEGAGIYAEVTPLHLQAAAKVAAAEIADYPVGQQNNARDSLIAWMDELLDAADDACLERIAKSIAKLKRDHGELATWRCDGGYIALDVPTVFVASVSRAYGAKRDIELRTLTGLLLPQLERIAPSILKGVLGAKYAGNRGDYERLVLVACCELVGEGAS
ncbi:hypothetical protein ELY33_05035 [Vreelandella andesensis]|uniref:Uncharacterized protein n=1 Tax=Vreelandella andesensis TaxID=447567 RepID=A0A433KT42_9GAMM|nr:hypothetical protein [Halomonas andesensis]RUR32746.1 hypothetical protein ELY33_05035 [Halomonas andesensis]